MNVTNLVNDIPITLDGFDHISCIVEIPKGTNTKYEYSGISQNSFEMKNTKRLIPHTLGDNAKDLEKALEGFHGTPIYLTFDLDWFDPSIMPGTGTPEPGGYLWRDFAAIVDVLQSHNLIGADVVELSPKLDNSGISSILAAKVIRSLIMLLDQ